MKANSGSWYHGRRAGLLVLGAFAACANAQKTQTTFDYGFPTTADDVATVTTSGVCEFALIGTGFPSTNDRDVFVSRHNAGGTPTWSRRVTGTPIELGMSVVGAANGDVLAAFTSNRGIADMATVIARFDPAGNVLWANHYPGALGSSISLAEAANGNVVAVCEYNAPTGPEGVFIRTTAAGGLLSVRRYAGDPATNTSQPRIFGLREFAGFWYLIGGFTDSATSSVDILLMGVDATGLPVVSFGYATTFPNIALTGVSIDVDPARGLAWMVQVNAPFPPPLFPTATLVVQSDLLGNVITTNAYLDSVAGRRVRWDPRFTDAAFASTFLFNIGTSAAVASRDFGGGSAGNSELYFDLAIPNLFTNATSIATPACDQDVVTVGAFTDPATPSGSAMYFVKAESVLASGCRNFAFFPQTLPAPLVQSSRSVVTSLDLRSAPFTGTFIPATPTTTPSCTSATCPRPQPACPADLDDGSMTGTPDGGVDISDLLYFINEFSIGTLNADVDDGLNSGDCDGGVTISDLLYYLTRFQFGC